MIGSRKFVTFNEVPGAVTYSLSAENNTQNYVANYKVKKTATENKDPLPNSGKGVSDLFFGEIFIHFVGKENFFYVQFFADDILTIFAQNCAALYDHFRKGLTVLSV